MEAKDLRVGNIINFSIEHVEECASIELFNIEFMVKYPQLFSKCFKPVPLTEEWLLKFGFNNMPNKHGFNIGRDANDFVLAKYTVIFRKSYIKKIKYVHQLQNLYFELTGEELELKE